MNKFQQAAKIGYQIVFFVKKNPFNEKITNTSEKLNKSTH